MTVNKYSVNASHVQRINDADLSHSQYTLSDIIQMMHDGLVRHANIYVP